MKTQEQKRFLHRALTSRGVLLFEIILIAIIGVGITKEIVRRVSLRNEISALQKQITNLEAQNKSLGDYVASINTDSFQEREARKRLNLQRPGETLLIVPDSTASSTNIATTLATQASSSHPQRWWSYFFRPHS